MQQWVQFITEYITKIAPRFNRCVECTGNHVRNAKQQTELDVDNTTLNAG